MAATLSPQKPPHKSFHSLLQCLKMRKASVAICCSKVLACYIITKVIERSHVQPVTLGFVKEYGNSAFMLTHRPKTVSVNSLKYPQQALMDYTFSVLVLHVFIYLAKFRNSGYIFCTVFYRKEIKFMVIVETIFTV